MEEDEIAKHRRARLRELVREYFNGSTAELIRAIEARTGTRPNQGEMSALQRENSGKSFGEKKARNLEDQIGLARGWFDAPGAHQDGAVTAANTDLFFKKAVGKSLSSMFESRAGKLPLISDVQAGNWSDIVDRFQPGDAEDWIACPFKHGPNAFILRVAGHSMYNPGGEKSYAPGEFIAVDPQVEPMNRKMVVARIDHEERATFKQLIIEPDGTHLLQALNPAWPNRIVPMPEGSRIVGVVIGKWTPE